MPSDIFNTTKTVRIISAKIYILKKTTIILLNKKRNKLEMQNIR